MKGRLYHSGLSINFPEYPEHQIRAFAGPRPLHRGDPIPDYEWRTCTDCEWAFVGAVATEGSLCSTCRKSRYFIERICANCAKPFRGVRTICGPCIHIERVGRAGGLKGRRPAQKRVWPKKERSE